MESIILMLVRTLASTVVPEMLQALSQASAPERSYGISQIVQPLETVKIIQRFINQYAPPSELLKVDGYLGPKTSTAISELGKRMSLTS